MDSDLKQAFQKAIYQPESRLSLDILLTIGKRESRIYKIKTWTHSIMGVVSLFLLFPSVKNLMTGLAGQGFYDYASLLVSDFRTVMSFSKEFILSLLNSLPIVSLSVSLFLVFVLFISIQRLVSQFRSKLLLA